MMVYRRKIILALLQIFDGELEKIRFQKLLFLLSKKQQKSEYQFVPYKYGCFSFSAQADLSTLAKKEIITESATTLIKNDKLDYIRLLKPEERTLVYEIKNLYGRMSSNALMKHTYINYPYFAINSLVAREVLNEVEYQNVLAHVPEDNDIILYTIGYEGVSIEDYLNKLIISGVKILVDVRRNPVSMKYGFSKNTLKRYCESVRIQYLHFPEVGIDSSERQELNTQTDYDNLFKTYSKKLPLVTDTQDKIINLLLDNKKIALTCFEADVCQCHRRPLAESLSVRGNLIIKHL